jgi:hypothetical protein
MGAPALPFQAHILRRITDLVKSLGLGRWLWLSEISSQAKAPTEPPPWPGPAWPKWGLAWPGFGLKPGQAQP